MPARRNSGPLRVLSPAVEMVRDAKVGGLGLNWEVVPDAVAGAAEAAAEWKRLSEVFDRDATRFREGDRSAVSAFCMSHALVCRAGTELLEDGLLVVGRSSADHGRRVKSPAWPVWVAASGQLRYWARELGLTPDARGRMGIVEKDDFDDDDNPFGSLLD